MKQVRQNYSKNCPSYNANMLRIRYGYNISQTLRYFFKNDFIFWVISCSNFWLEYLPSVFHDYVLLRYDKWVPCHESITYHRVVSTRNGRHVCETAANMMNGQFQTFKCDVPPDRNRERGFYTSWMKDATSLRRKTERGQTSSTHGETRTAYKIWLANCAEWDKFEE
jgi:hypothetical protein